LCNSFESMRITTLRPWLFTALKLLWGIYFLLTSAYCLLAFLPYTYFALIKAPPYDWVPWFAHHQAALYFFALAGAATAEWLGDRGPKFAWLFGGLALAGFGLVARPFLPILRDSWPAYTWSLIALVPLVLLAAIDVHRCWQATADNVKQGNGGTLSYGATVVIAISVAILYAIGVEVHRYFDQRSFDFRQTFSRGKIEILAWSLISHVLVAVVLVSALNLIGIAGARMRQPERFRLMTIGTLAAAALWFVLARFLNGALSFQGWAAQIYAAALAVSVTLLIASLILPLLSTSQECCERDSRTSRHPLSLIISLLALSSIAVALPTLIGGGDWNGVLQHSFTLFFWIAFSVCLFGLWPRHRAYTATTVLGVLLLSGFAYRGLQETAIFWAKPLGSTDDEVSLSLETYAAQDFSFQFAHHLLGNARYQTCGNLCRILREYTNIRDAEAITDVKLVDPLLPVASDKPNIFIFVIDSVRPDYLGAYNPRVDFTPNLDAFAHENIAVHNVYTQYAGTTLSEPAIWSGAMLLHAHYMQPFSRVNGLEKLARADGYQIVLSFDTVLSQILSPDDDIIKLDTEKPLWNRVEVCSTIQQTEVALETRVDKKRPVLFYSQPMNVHQFAVNNLPGMNSQNWRIRPGFNNRIAYELHQVDDCLGGFLNFLKTRGLYDKSIIIVTSDHGDATGELGRFSHSTSIYPEIMRVPLLVHLPPALRRSLVYDDTHLSALTDITPSLYYLLGHRPIVENPLFGHALFVDSREELKRSQRTQLFLASDERAVYGLLMNNGRLLYTTYDSPAQSFLFDLDQDPNAQHNLLTDSLQKAYAQQVIENLQMVGDFYGYRPGASSLLASAH
jgi:glucan phosphoethanolaminetransferase (alkaline phosphatase superfamily)